jgi:hypothetical protein
MKSGNELGLGALLTAELPRDAVHIAVIPVVAGEKLPPGHPVYLVDGKALPCPDTWKDERTGIVDPFLDVGPDEGQWFWLFLYPGTIVSLRHEWQHPAFASTGRSDSERQSDSERWLRKFAEDNGVGFQRMIGEMTEGEGIHLGRDIECYTDEEFWKHMEAYTGRRFDDDHRANTYFSCSC